jgi:hypothetical protein
MSVLILASMLLGKLQSENEIARLGHARRKHIREKYQLIRKARTAKEAEENKSLAPAEEIPPCCHASCG